MFIHDYSLIGRKVISVLISFFFIFTSIIPPQQSYAQVAPQSVLNLPIPGSFVTQTSGFNPAIVEGITLHEDNPLLFDFIVTRGDSGLEKEELKAEANKLIKYFLASLTVPEKDMWVNLSPYEQDRIIPEGFGDTEMGRDLLAQDYMLKQLTASLMYPEEELGRKFWNRVYSRAQQEYGTTQIPVNTFNKVWIVPEKAVVYEHENSAFVVDSHLKVMLEEDYVAINENNVIAEADNNLLQTEIIKEIIIPEIEREVNEGKIFAQLRQIYNSMILATWYKQNLQQSLLGKVYVDQNKTKGVDTQDKDINQKIYNQYVEAFKKGVYNYIKEDIDPVTSEAIPRKYFSGGLGFNGVADSVMEVTNVFNLKYESFINRVSSSSLDNGVYNFQAGIFEDNEKSRLDTSFLPINELKDSNRFAYDFVMEQVAALNAGEIEGVDARDYERLLAEAVDAGELQLTADGNYIANSHSEDVARVEKRTYIATRNEKDKGNNNNWQHTDNLLPKVMEKIQDSYVKKDGAKEKLYFIPYLMGPKGSEFSEVGIQVTNSRYVAISMINMAKVGWDALDHLKGSDNFVKGIHSTGDLENINRSGTEEDDRYFVAFPEEKMIISYGSNYGGNVLLGKKFHSLRMASYKARKEGWLAEHMMIVEVINKKTKEKDYFAGAFPSASGKTNLAMLLPPKILSNDYEVNIIGDDIAWLRPGKDGRLYAINPENGYFGVVPGTNKESNPQFMEAIEKGNSIYTNVAYNEKTKEVWWEGKTKEYPFLRGNGKFWKDWRGHYIIDRKLENRKRKGKDFLWAHANSRVAVASKNMPNLANSYVNGEAVPISGILWGGRVAKLEPLIKELKTIEEGIYDGATMYAEATSASQDVNPGDPVADSMAQKPFFSYHEHEFFQHWLDVIGKLSNPPKFFHINWFRKGDDGEFIWPGFGENLRALIWASERIRGKANYIVTEMGNIPKMDSILLEGVNLTRALKKETFLAKFSGKEKVWNRMIEKGWIFPSEKDSNKMKADPQVIANDPDLGNDLKLDEVILSKIKDFLAISYDVSKNLKDAIYLPSKKKLERELKRRKEYLRGLENKHHKTPAAFLKVEEKLEAAVEAMSGEEEYIVSSSSTTIFQIEERGFEEVSVYVAKRVITLLMEYLNEVVSIEEDKILLADLDQIRYSDEASEIFDILKRVIEYNFLVKFNDKSIYYESGQGRIKNSTESLNSVLAGIKYLLEEELERIDGKILKINGFRVSSLINIKSSSPLSLNYSSPAIEEYVSNLEHPSWSNVKKISNDSKSYLDSLFDKSFVDIGLQYFRQYANWVEVELVDKNGYKYTEKFLNIRVQNLIGNGINKGGDRAETLSQLSNELTEEGKFFLNHLNHIIDMGATEGDIENFIVKWAVDEKTFLAAVMYLKINGLDLVLRGAKGGILLVKVTRESRNFHIEDLENLDLEENQARIWQARVWDLLEHNIIGPNIDVPAGDIGVDAKVIAWEMEAVIRYFHLKTTEIHDAYPELARRLDVIEALRGNNKINGTLDSTKTPALEAMVQFQEEQQKDLQKKAEEDVGVDNVTSDMWAVPMPWLATFSSKPPKFGGLKGRDKATAEGAIDALIAVRKHQGLGASLKGVTFSVEGWGNASKYFIVGVLKRGARILAMNSSKMGLINDSFWEGKDDANFFDNIIRVYGDKYPLNKAWANSKINWSKNSIKVVNRNEAARAIRSVKIDYFVPAAIQGTVTSDNFQEIKATRGIVEISNGAILRDAEQRLIVENGINFVIPDVIANPGGVVVSILEHRGNMRGYHDTDEEVDEKRAKYVQNSVENTFRMQKKIKEISLRAAHNLVSEDIRSRSTLYKFMTEGFMLGKDGENNLDNKWNLEAMLKFLGYDQEDYRREEWNVLLEDFEKYITNKGFYKVGIEGREEEFNLGEVLIKAWNEAFIVKLENLMNKFVSHEVRKEIADELKNKLDLDFKINAYKTLKKMEYLLSVPDNNFFVEIQNFVSESSQEQSVSSPMTHNEDISEQLGILFQNLEESLHDVQIKLNAVQRGFSKGEGEDPFENFKAEMFDMAFGTFEELRTELLPGAKIPDKFLHFLNFIHYDSILEDGNPYGSDSYSLYYLWPVEQLLKSFMKTQVRVNGYNILDEWLMGRKDIASFENSIYLGTGSSPIGGINFNPDLLNLQIKRDGKGVPLPMWDQDWEMMENIQGFFPVIINVTPVMNFPMLLGLREEDFPNNDSANTCSDDGDSALCDERAIPINRWEEELAVM